MANNSRWPNLRYFCHLQVTILFVTNFFFFFPCEGPTEDKPSDSDSDEEKLAWQQEHDAECAMCGQFFHSCTGCGYLGFG